MMCFLNGNISVKYKHESDTKERKTYMIKYGDLVQYTKKNYVNWETDLFSVLRGFFEQYSPTPTPPSPVQQEIIFSTEEFKEPEEGEYTTQDLINLFSL